jgi:lysophospholipase L1-like esterase
MIVKTSSVQSDRSIQHPFSTDQRPSRLGGFILLSVILSLCLQVEAGTKRILVVGDSWAAFMTHPMTGEIFQHTLKTEGYEEAEIVATEKTAVPGSRADQWATNHKGKLDDLKQTLATNLTVDIVFLVIGGNDFLREAIKTNLSNLTAGDRARLWAGIRTNIQTVVDTILAVRPSLKVVLCDYDYLNVAEAARSPMKQSFNGIAQSDFNHYFVDVGREKRAIAGKSNRCLYIQNWGLMQYYFGDPEQKYEAKTVPYPGGSPAFDPYPGGDPGKPGPAKAFNQGALNDGIHLNPEGFRLIIENALKQGLGAMLKTVSPKTRNPETKPAS